MSDREAPATSWAVWAWQAYRDGRLVEADRIEELEAKLAKLAKAVEVLAELATDVYPHDWRAIATLAELKGQDDE